MEDSTQQPAAAGTAELATGALDLNQAASVFASLREPPKEQKQETPAAAPKAEPEQKREPEVTAKQLDAADPEQPAAATQADEPTVTFIDHEGKEVTLKQSDLVNGYKAQKASTQKYEAAAALRKEAETEGAKARDERQRLAAGLNQAEAILVAHLQEQSKTDWHALREQNPQEFLKQWHLFNERQATLQGVRGQRAQINQVEYAEAQNALARTLAEGRQELLAKVPEWRDDVKMKADHDRIAKELIDRGFPPESIYGVPNPDGSVNPMRPGIVDPKIMLLARDAMLYREMLAKAKAAADKVVQLPTKVEKPGGGETNPLDGRTTAMRRLGQTGSIDDAAAAFSAMRRST